MTLPQQEIDRIERCNDGHEIGACIAEASLWFKRMGEFAEWVSINYIQTSDGIWRKYSDQSGCKFTTPELIELFINSLNEKK